MTRDEVRFHYNIKFEFNLSRMFIVYSRKRIQTVVHMMATFFLQATSSNQLLLRKDIPILVGLI